MFIYFDLAIFKVCFSLKVFLLHCVQTESPAVSGGPVLVDMLWETQMDEEKGDPLISSKNTRKQLCSFLSFLVPHRGQRVSQKTQGQGLISLAGIPFTCSSVKYK